MKQFKNAVVWGHKLGTHTHSYVHNAFYEAFKYMGYNAYHLDDNDNVSNIDFSNTVFITEGQVDRNIPLRKDCGYIIHNCNGDKYRAVGANVLGLQVLSKGKAGEKINNYTYFDGSTVFLPWATDLLPNQIVPNTIPKENNIYYVGTVKTNDWNNAFIDCENFARAASAKNINFMIIGGYSYNIQSEYVIARGGFINNELAIKLVKKSYLAPIFQGSNQKTLEYIPCRLFKNISYGQPALTNCSFLEHFFEEEPIIYNENTYDLFFQAEQMKDKQNLDKLMQIVKEKHTFVNRITQMLELI